MDRSVSDLGDQGQGVVAEALTNLSRGREKSKNPFSLFSLPPQGVSAIQQVNADWSRDGGSVADVVLFSASRLADEERVLAVTRSMSMPVKNAMSIAELATANATCHPKKIQSATKPYQLNQRVAIRKAHAGPARLPPRHSVSAVGIAVQQHNGVKHPIVAPIKLARHREYPDR